MTAGQIMNDGAVRKTWHRTALDCDCATRNATDDADWRESEVIFENTLHAGNIMREAMK